jgi:S1-C subfamily serine protease
VTTEVGSNPKIVISTSEVESVALPTGPLDAPKMQKPIPLWARLVMLPLVLALPLLAIIATVMRIALRAAAPRTQQAWHSYLMALLIAGSLVFTTTAVLMYSFVPMPPQAISAGLSDLDERTNYPELPTQEKMTGVEVAQRLKPLVMIASPAARRWFFHGEVATNYVGAAVLLHASRAGYLFATARHVAAASSMGSKSARRVLLTTASSGWAGADVVAMHRTADLALLWLPRRSGSVGFAQPLAVTEGVQEGSNVFVIGHPEGLNFTITNGMISRLAGDIVQISAPVSPGNSGGPVYDDRGNLLGIVVAKLDRNVDPNAENLNFAASARLLSQVDGWEFTHEGRRRLTEYVEELTQRVHANGAH